MKKFILLVSSLLVMTVAANASAREDFVRIDAVERSASMVSEAVVLPVDELLFEEVMSLVNEYASVLAEQGDEVSAAMISHWVLANKGFFTSQRLLTIKEILSGLDSNTFDELTYVEYKDPTISLVLSIVVGSLGVDRFYIGDVGLGVGKLLTMGGLGIWWLIDLFQIQKATKNKNYEEFNQFLGLIQ